MAESKSNAALWVAGIAGLIAIATWLALGGTSDDPERRAVANVPAAIPAPPTNAAVPREESRIFRIGAQKRLSIDESELPTDGPMTLDLELADDARAIAEQAVRVISTDGRRIDTMATPLPGAGSGVRMEIDPGFLTRGRYMIEIDTVDKHPLQIRRYVLELR